MKTPYYFNAIFVLLFLCIFVVGYLYIQADAKNGYVTVDDYSYWEEGEVKERSSSMPTSESQAITNVQSVDKHDNQIEENIVKNSEVSTVSERFVDDQDGIDEIISDTVSEIVSDIDNELQYSEPDTPPDSDYEYSGMVNINTDSKALLCTLDGVGEVIAQRIIDFRNTYGEFSSIDEIMLVSGIGEAKYNKIKDRITI